MLQGPTADACLKKPEPSKAQDILLEPRPPCNPRCKVRSHGRTVTQGAKFEAARLQGYGTPGRAVIELHVGGTSSCLTLSLHSCCYKVPTLYPFSILACYSTSSRPGLLLTLSSEKSEC